jgi:preprotein translocase subunit SecA
MEDDVPIEHPWTTKAIENAQKKVEGHNYDIRKHLLQYDDVMNEQRKVIYAMRKEVLARKDGLKDMIVSMADDLSTEIAEDFFPGGKLRRGEGGQALLDEKALNDALASTFQTPLNLHEADITPFTGAGLKALLVKRADEIYEMKRQTLTPPLLQQVERMILLTTIDHLWKDHLLAMDHLREGIGLQGYGQKDPLIAYKKEGFRFFGMMMGQITGDVVRKLFAVQLAPHIEEELEAEEKAIWHDTQEKQAAPESISQMAQQQPMPAPAAPASAKMQYAIGPDGQLVPAGIPAGASAPPAPSPAGAPRPSAESVARASEAMDLLSRRGPSPAKMTLSHGGMAVASGGARPAAGDPFAAAGRNDPCPCGSGKKFKKCHGAS